MISIICRLVLDGEVAEWLALHYSWQALGFDGHFL